MKDRELDQLLLVANHYLSQAKRACRTVRGVLDRTLREVADSHARGRLRPQERILAHLDSCAIRLCTICEKENVKATRWIHVRRTSAHLTNAGCSGRPHRAPLSRIVGYQPLAVPPAKQRGMSCRNSAS